MRSVLLEILFLSLTPLSYGFTTSRLIGIETFLKMRETSDKPDLENYHHTSRSNVGMFGIKSSSVDTIIHSDIDRRHLLQSASVFGCGIVSTYYMSPDIALADEDVSIALCDPSVSTWKNVKRNRVVHILGTAHISSSSADLAGKLVREVSPDAVFVELDAKRVARALPPSKAPQNDDGVNKGSDIAPSREESLMSQTTSSSTLSSNASEVEQQPLKKANPFDLREKAMRYSSQAIGSAIKGLYKKLESEGFNAGEEFQVAVKEGVKVNAKIILGDQDVEVTLRRLAEAVSKTDMKKLLAADSDLERNMKELMPGDMMQSSIDKGEMNKEQLTTFVETVKAKENVRLLMNNLKTVAPEIYGAMVAERDAFMANGLNGLNQFQSVVAVMGIAHVDGVESNLRQMGWEPVGACPLVRT